MTTKVEIFEYFAKDCMRAAEQTDEPKYRKGTAQVGNAGEGRRATEPRSIDTIDVAENGAPRSFMRKLGGDVT
jgi:hypothetical protein